MSTEKSIHILAGSARRGTNAKDWKRTKKIRSGYDEVRYFRNKVTGEELAVVQTGLEFTVHPPSEIQPPDRSLTNRLKKACAKIKHCGDYCHLYWNQATRTAFMVMGDGDCAEPLTTVDEIKELLTAAGATRVQVEPESFPDLTDGFFEIGLGLGRAVEVD